MTYTFTDFPVLNDLVRNYLRFCIRYYAQKGLEIKLDDQEWWKDNFIQETTNNWENNTHFNIEDYRFYHFYEHEELSLSRIDELPEELIVVINTYFEEHFGEESVKDFDDIRERFRWTFIINCYAYAYTDWLDNNEHQSLCEDLEEVLRQYKEDDDALREEDKEDPLDPAEEYTCVVCLESQHPFRRHPSVYYEGIIIDEDQSVNCDWCKSGVWCESCHTLLRKGGEVKCPICRQINPKPKPKAQVVEITEA